MCDPAKLCSFGKEEHNSDDETAMLGTQPQPISRKSLLCRQSVLPQLAPLNWVSLVVLIVVISLIKVGIRLDMDRFPDIPDPTTFGIKPESVSKNLLDTDQFVTVRARNSLEMMSSFGVRPAGSLAAERLTVKWLVEELEFLKKKQQRDSHSKLAIDVDQVSGFFNLGLITSVYSNITNVLARLDPVSGDKNNTLLMNCHFDSFFEAIGASDDAVNCAIMLEILRSLMSSATPLNHSVIFLFNGAEENILQASHGFIAGTSKTGGYIDGAGHPWSKNIRAFINLEAAGSGGREILFQAGPGAATPVLVRAYASSAPYPFASVVGQEVFQAGLIPSDTDFRIFRDFGHLPGMDFAFYTNGFVYHTRFDTPDRIPNGSIQRSGSNWLGIVKYLATSDLSKMPPIDNPGEKLVYFDVFSTFLIVYPFQTVGLAINIIAIAGTIGRIIWRCFKDGAYRYLTIFLVAILAHLIAIALAVGVLLLIATWFSKMTWYARPWLLFPIYALPGVGAAFLAHGAIFKYAIVFLCQTADFTQKCKIGYDISFDAALFIGSVAIGAFSAASLATSYIVVIWVGPSLLLATLIPLPRYASAWYITIRHAVLTTLPTVYYLYVTDLLLDIFVPITGRDGMDVNPEYIIAALVLLVVGFLLIFHTPIVYLVGGNVLPVVGLIVVITGTILTLTASTSLGNPFMLDRDRPDGAHIQRSTTQLTLQKMNKSTIHSGIWFVPSDFNGVEALTPVLGDFFKKSRTPCLSPEDIANNSLFCQLPNVYPCTQVGAKGTHWVDVDLTNETLRNITITWPDVNLMWKSKLRKEEGQFLIQFRINCGETPHCALYISPRHGVRLLRWHYGDDDRQFNPSKLRQCPWPTSYDPNPTWLVNVRFGSPSSDRKWLHYLYLTMEIEVSHNLSVENLFSFKVASQYFRGSSSTSIDVKPKELYDFVESLPDWHHTYAVTTFYSAHSF